MGDLKTARTQIDEMADLLELKKENKFKVAAFRNAVRALLGTPVSSETTVEELLAIKGIGKGIAPLIHESLTTGTIKDLEGLREEFPEGVREMLQIRGFGPSKVRAVWQDLGVNSPGELAYACRENRLVRLKGFGDKIQAKVLEGVELLERTRGRTLLSKVMAQAGPLLDWLKANGHPEAALTGDAGMARATVADAAILIKSNGQSTLDLMKQAPDLLEGPEEKDGATAVRLSGGLPLKVIAVEGCFVTQALKLTSSPVHWQSLKISEDAVFADEAALYASAGLRWVPPERREGLDELEVYRLDKPEPELIGFDGVLGVFHNHTLESDGANSLDEMAAEAQRLGYRYFGVSEHSKTSYVANGLDIERLLAQQERVRALQASFPELRLFHGVECDILPDGSLDYPDEVLARLDFVVASVHGWLNQPREEMTARLIKAISHPSVTMLGHPTGRLLLARNPYQVDMEAVLQAAAKHGKVMELNANPRRLDLDWQDLRRAKELGVKISINPDAHSLEGLSHTYWGILQARKAGLAPCDVFNSAGADAIAGALGLS